MSDEAMIEVGISDLVGQALDWVVAQIVEPDGFEVTSFGLRFYTGDEPVGKSVWSPSTDWSQGGPLIDDYWIEIRPHAKCPDGGRSGKWIAHFDHSGCHDDYLECENKPFGLGPSPLVAACRAIVAANLGKRVAVPQGLLGKEVETCQDQ